MLRATSASGTTESHLQNLRFVQVEGSGFGVQEAKGHVRMHIARFIQAYVRSMRLYFDNTRFRTLVQTAGRRLVTRAEGLQELRLQN